MADLVEPASEIMMPSFKSKSPCQLLIKAMVCLIGRSRWWRLLGERNWQNHPSHGQSCLFSRQCSRSLTAIITQNFLIRMITLDTERHRSTNQNRDPRYRWFCHKDSLIVLCIVSVLGTASLILQDYLMRIFQEFLVPEPFKNSFHDHTCSWEGGRITSLHGCLVKVRGFRYPHS